MPFVAFSFLHAKIVDFIHSAKLIGKKSYFKRMTSLQRMVEFLDLVTVMMVKVILVIFDFGNAVIAHYNINIYLYYSGGF